MGVIQNLQLDGATVNCATISLNCMGFGKNVLIPYQQTLNLGKNRQQQALKVLEGKNHTQDIDGAVAISVDYCLNLN